MISPSSINILEFILSEFLCLYAYKMYASKDGIILLRPQEFFT